MADTTITPNMSLPVPVPSTAPGPQWATNVVACFSGVDSHNHTSGQGVPITPAAITINADLPFGGNNATTLRSVNLTSQDAPLAGATDLGCVYVSGDDLYYNDEQGNQIRITQGGSVAGSTGTITGLPSGTASASYSAGTFTFQSATSTPATMAVGPLVIGRAAASPKTVTLAPNASQAADYGLTFPAALPGSTSMVSIDTSGNIATVATTGSGSVVLATAPTFAGVPAGTITAASFSPTITWTNVSGSTVTIVNDTSTWYYLRIGNTVSVSGYLAFTVTGSPSSTVYTAKATVPISTASLSVAGSHITSNALPILTSTGIGALTNSSTTAVITQNMSIGGTGSDVLVFSYFYSVS